VSFVFQKWQALGNDFIITESLPDSKIIASIPRFCHRRFGIGADGFIFIDCNHNPPKMHFFNADGTCVKMCGNGLRSAIFYLKDRQKEPKIEFEGNVYESFESEGQVFVPMPYPQKLDCDLPAHEGLWILAGVPHYLMAKDDVHQGDLDPDIFNFRYHSAFGQEGTNITFYQIKDKKCFLRTCERGVDEETLSCGSAALACAYLIDEPCIEMIYKTGAKAIVKKTEKTIALSGHAEKVFEGHAFYD
jgi:diaminopimelate epimerase